MYSLTEDKRHCM